VLVPSPRGPTHGRTADKPPAMCVVCLWRQGHLCLSCTFLMLSVLFQASPLHFCTGCLDSLPILPLACWLPSCSAPCLLAPFLFCLLLVGFLPVLHLACWLLVTSLDSLGAPVSLLCSAEELSPVEAPAPRASAGEPPPGSACQCQCPFHPAEEHPPLNLAGESEVSSVTTPPVQLCAEYVWGICTLEKNEKCAYCHSGYSCSSCRARGQGESGELGHKCSCIVLPMLSEALPRVGSCASAGW